MFAPCGKYSACRCITFSSPCHARRGEVARLMPRGKSSKRAPGPVQALMAPHSGSRGLPAVGSLVSPKASCQVPGGKDGRVTGHSDAQPPGHPCRAQTVRRGRAGVGLVGAPVMPTFRGRSPARVTSGGTLVTWCPGLVGSAGRLALAQEPHGPQHREGSAFSTSALCALTAPGGRCESLRTCCWGCDLAS